MKPLLICMINRITLKFSLPNGWECEFQSATDYFNEMFSLRNVRPWHGEPLTYLAAQIKRQFPVAVVTQEERLADTIHEGDVS